MTCNSKFCKSLLDETLRQEAQNVLEQMLDAQKTLENNAVSVWAAETYYQALGHAEAGDGFYGQRDYPQALAEYEQALSLMLGLVERVDLVFEESMEKGNQALVEGDAPAALSAFEIALAMDPIDRAATSGMARAKVLDEVLELVKLGNQLANRNRFEEARSLYEEALVLDAESSLVKERIKLVDDQLLDRQFNQEMSAGFNALQANKLTAARRAFNSALKLKPKSVEAKRALEQTAHGITTQKINALLTEARSLEASEQWHVSESRYTAALELDSALVEAVDGQQRAALRAQLHDRLEKIIAEPKRIYDQKHYDETTEFYTKIARLSDAGPILTRQLQAVKGLLEKATIPVNVRLRSDNLTNVTVYRVGELGAFSSKDLTVRPGRYIAKGTRDGHRDVRVEFMADPDLPAPVVTVQASEPISIGGSLIKR